MTKLNLLTMIQKEYFSHLKTMKNSNSLGRKSLILRLKLLKKASILSQKLKAEKSVIEMTVYDDISDDKTAQMLSEIRQGKIAEISEKTDE